MRPVMWLMIALGVGSGVAGWFLHGSARDTEAEAAAYRRELNATIGAMLDDPGLARGLPRTAAWTKRAAEKATEALGFKADIEAGNGRVEVGMKGISHRDLMGLLAMLERSGLSPSEVRLEPDSFGQVYSAAALTLECEAGR